MSPRKVMPKGRCPKCGRICGVKKNGNVCEHYSIAPNRLWGTGREYHYGLKADPLEKRP